METVIIPCLGSVYSLTFGYIQYLPSGSIDVHAIHFLNMRSLAGWKLSLRLSVSASVRTTKAGILFIPRVKLPEMQCVTKS